MPVTPIGKIFKPKLREIAAGEAARELLAAEGLANHIEIEAATDPSRGLHLCVAAAPGHAEKARQLLQRFPLKIEMQA